MLTVIKDGTTQLLEPVLGETILSALGGLGSLLHSPCGGKQRCGKCLVRAQGTLSAPGEREIKLLGSEIEKGMRLACFAHVEGECTVWLGEEGAQNTKAQNDFGADVLSPLTDVKFRFPPAEAGDVRSDEQRFKELLHKNSGICAEKLPLDVLSALPDAWNKDVFLLSDENDIVYAGCDDGRIKAGLAVDIGTTTVAAYFYELSSGKRLYTVSGENRQKNFGADVISRIDAAADSLETLRSEISSQIDAYIEEFTELFCADIAAVCVAGNTVMLHLFCGISPQRISVIPFTSVTLFGFSEPASKYLRHVLPSAVLYLPPCVSSFVGADITVGMAAMKLLTSDKLTLYLDIGTNGEIALGDKNGFVCCAAAAGPAFEGAHISCGMAGVEGAIDSVFENGSGRMDYTVIGGGEPAGICGSGLIDAVAYAVSREIIFESGYINEESPYAFEKDGMWCIKIGESGLALTSRDIREVQLAKAAIAAGIETLIAESKKQYDDIGRVIIAGGFGQHIDIKSACAIGLLPSALIDVVETPGNLAGKGAVTALTCSGRRNVEAMASAMRYVDLSSSPVFQTSFYEHMIFE